MRIRPGILRIVHGCGYASTESMEAKRACIKQVLTKCKADGYDGIVTNVNSPEYLRDPAEWELMQYKAALCRQLGLRLWIYDEDGYPSGAAGTLTLDTAPAGEARAAVMVTRLLKPGETFTCPLPHGHTAPLAACGYYLEGDVITDDELSAAPIQETWTKEGYHFANTSAKNLLCMCFFEKPAYEGTHAVHNVHAARRYIDIGNKTAGDTFIRNTYKPYIDTLGEDIEAFFTDEPSYIGNYFPYHSQPQNTIHPYDTSIPFFPMVKWSYNLLQRFREAYGYPLEPHLPALFLGNSKQCCDIRRDFCNLTTMLAEEGYFQNIGDYCESRRRHFSGHLLFEDTMRLHAQYEGNFFKLLRHMHIPGMDMLHSIPEELWELAFIPLLIRSVSELYRDGHVMDEVSAHDQRGNVNDAEIFGSLMLQYTFGADIFTSYYGDKLADNKVNGISIVEAVKFVQAKTADRSPAEVIVHYPIETVMALQKPETEGIEAQDRTADAIRQCEQSTYGCMHALLDHQIPLMFSDTASLEKAAKQKPRFVILPAQIIDEQLLNEVKALSATTCKVIAFSSDNPYFSTDALAPYATVVSSFDEMIHLLAENGLIRTAGDTAGVAALWMPNGVMLTNSTKTEKKIQLHHATTQAVDCRDRTPVAFSVAGQKTILTLAPYQTVLLEM